MIIRPIKDEELYLLKDFLYEAIFQPDKNNLLPREIIKQPELRVYIEGFGGEHDNCLVAEIDGEIVGAVWTRVLSGEIKGYGSIDDITPELSISVYEEHRNKGIGSQLMKGMLKLLKKKDYKQVSLSVQKKNYASKIYQKIGFNVLEESSEGYIMVYDFNKLI